MLDSLEWSSCSSVEDFCSSMVNLAIFLAPLKGQTIVWRFGLKLTGEKLPNYEVGSKDFTFSGSKAG